MHVRLAVVTTVIALAACNRGPEGARPPSLASAPSVFSQAGWDGATADPASSVPGSAVAAAARLVAAVEELEARVARLDPAAYALPVGLGCAAACDLLGVAGVTWDRGEARCACRRLPSLGTTPKLIRNRAARAQKAASLQDSAGPSARVKAPGGPL